MSSAESRQQERRRNHIKYIASWSGGKDSTESIIVERQIIVSKDAATDTKQNIHVLRNSCGRVLSYIGVEWEDIPAEQIKLPILVKEKGKSCHMSENSVAAGIMQVTG